MSDSDALTPLRCPECDSHITLAVAEFIYQARDYQAEYVYTCECTTAGVAAEDFPDHWLKAQNGREIDEDD